MGGKELDTASIDKESFCKEKQRSGVIAGGECEVKKCFFKMEVIASCLYANGNNSLNRGK